MNPRIPRHKVVMVTCASIISEGEVSINVVTNLTNNKPLQWLSDSSLICQFACHMGSSGSTMINDCGELVCVQGPDCFGWTPNLLFLFRVLHVGQKVTIPIKRQILGQARRLANDRPNSCYWNPYLLSSHPKWDLARSHSLYQEWQCCICSKWRTFISASCQFSNRKKIFF